MHNKPIYRFFDHFFVLHWDLVNLPLSIHICLLARKLMYIIANVITILWSIMVIRHYVYRVLAAPWKQWVESNLNHIYFHFFCNFCHIQWFFIFIFGKKSSSMETKLREDEEKTLFNLCSTHFAYSKSKFLGDNFFSHRTLFVNLFLERGATLQNMLIEVRVT